MAAIRDGHAHDPRGDPTEILQLRLANQHLARQRSTDPRAMVAHLGAVQSQDYPAALQAAGIAIADGSVIGRRGAGVPLLRQSRSGDAERLRMVVGLDGGRRAAWAGGAWPAVRERKVSGLTFWFASSGAATRALGPAALLLPNYDEFTVAYRSRELFYARALVWRPGPRDDAPFGNVIVIGGQVVGMWKRSVVKERLRIEPRWFNSPSRREETAFTEVAERYAAFVGCRL